MLIVSLLLAATLAGEPGPPSAKAQTEALPPQAAPAKQAKPRKICVEEARLGSLMSHRICATQEEWDRRAERDAAEMAKARSVPNSGPQ